ncbi:MAG: 3'(2'), 5'-bisphosphate nucleotidase [Rickettsiales bacterium]|jgi:3'(2'), 5'-bisphosphate nucleotidase
MLNQNKISEILDIAKKAGDIILEYYQDYKKLDTIQKYDDSPVTKADLAANDLIIKELNILFPNIAIVSEENEEGANLKAAQEQQYFMIDPLDGTSSFIKKSDEWTVNIALIKDRSPIFGVIYLPARDLMYFTDENNKSWKIENYSQNKNQSESIKTASNKNNLIVICTKREPEKSEVIADLKNRNISVKEIISISSSYKFCLIADGSADLYPRKVNIKAWDVAAGHAIVNGAGGNMINFLNKKELEYKFDNSFDIPFFEVL